MSDQLPDKGGRRRFGIAVATITGFIYFVLLVLGALKPEALARPMGDGRFSVGLLVGSLLILFIVGCGAIYTFGLTERGERK